jgi:hypothetical protein
MIPRSIDRAIQSLIFSEPTLNGRLGTFVISGFFLFGGIVVGRMGASPLLDFLSSQNWVETEARVLNSEVEKVGDTNFEVKVRFAYDFADEAFEGDVYQFGEGATNIGVREMEKVVARFETGQVIQVWVDPEEPSRSVIERSISYQVLVHLLGAVPFLLGGGCGWLYAFFSGWAWQRGRALRNPWVEKAVDPIRTCLEFDLIRKGQTLAVTSMAGRIEGLLALGIAIFWFGIVGALAIGMAVMLASGEAMGFFAAFIVIPMLSFGFVIGFGVISGLARKSPPPWIVLAENFDLGRYLNLEGVVRLHWMPVPDQRDDSRSLSIGVIRIKSGVNFKKWKRENPHWKEARIPLNKGEGGSEDVALPAVDGGKKHNRTPYTLQLLVWWQDQQGVEREATVTLESPDND